ncbi:MAG: uL22 family ribosomal protein, partial [Rhodothermales bacterium]
MKARAIRKHIRTSPRKMRPVINLVRGKSVAEAL